MAKYIVWLAVGCLELWLALNTSATLAFPSAVFAFGISLWYLTRGSNR